MLLFGLFFAGYNEDLDKMEKKVEAVAKQRIADALKDDSKERQIRMSEVVAVFVSDWHKYVRATVKRREGDDLYCVWALDYGVPMVVHASNIVKLPSAFTGMHLNKQREKRIHTGGMENCLPAEKRFNIANESSDKQKLLNWTPQAIDLVQKILNQAIKVEFEHVEDLAPMKRPHFFGRLMICRPSDGEMINVVKSLLEMNMAVLAEQEFKIALTSIESLNQPIMFSAHNELLDVQMCVLPIKIVSKTDTGFSNEDMFESENEDELLSGENDADLPIEDNEFFDDSASVIKPKLRNNSTVGDALAPVPENPKESHADRSCSNASQAKSKSNSSKDTSEADAQNNNASSEKQQPKKAKKNRDRKQKGKKISKVSSQNDQTQNGPQKQQPGGQESKPKQPPQQQNHQSQQPQKQNHHPPPPQQQQHHHQPYHHRQPIFDHRAPNGEQNNSNFQHLPHPKPLLHPAVPNHYRAQGMRNPQDPRFNGCTEFEAIIGKPLRYLPPPMPYMNRFPPTPMLGPIPAQRPHHIDFRGMYGPPHSPRQSNLQNSFHDDVSQQTMHLKSMLNIQSQNHPKPNSNANQRGSNRMRNRNSGHQGQNNQPAESAGKTNGNANNELRDKGELKPIAKKNTAPPTIKPVKTEQVQTTGEHAE